MSQRDVCALTKCKYGVSMFWNGKCSCEAQSYICSLKSCRDSRQYSSLVKNQCYCMWKKEHCSKKTCPRGMTGKWSVLKTGHKNSCRCQYTRKNCGKMTCHPQKQGRWYNG